MKQCRKGPKRFQFILFNDALVYGEKLPGAATVKYNRLIDLNQAMVTVADDTSPAFDVASAAKSFIVTCSSVYERKSSARTGKSCPTRA